MSQIGQPEIDSLSAFLKYGPLGLAGLTLVIVLIALFLDVTPSRESLLKWSLCASAFFLVAILIANHYAAVPSGPYPLFFRVIPLQEGSRAARTLPPPIITANETRIEEDKPYSVSSQVTAIVDVKDAIDLVGKLQSQNDRQRGALTEVISSSDALASELQKVPQILNPPHSDSNTKVTGNNPAVVAITSKAADTLATFKTTASEALAEP